MKKRLNHRVPREQIKINAYIFINIMYESLCTLW